MDGLILLKLLFVLSVALFAMTIDADKCHKYKDNMITVSAGGIMKGKILSKTCICGKFIMIKFLQAKMLIFL